MKTIDFSAQPTDGRAILDILESSASKGDIELIYTRRPDAYASYMKESGGARVFVSRHDGKAVGTCAEIVRDVYIGGKPCKAAYICGLKRHSGYNGHIGFTPGFIESLYVEDVKLHYCSVVADNDSVINTFERLKRIVSAKPVTRYTTYILNTRVRIKRRGGSLEFRQASACDLQGIIEFLNTEGKKHDLFPCVSDIGDFCGLRVEDFYLLTENGEIKAIGALWNQSEYKQYVVKRYGGVYRLAKRLSPLLSALGYIRLPKENLPLCFPTLSFLLCKDNSEDYFCEFFNRIMQKAQETYGMLILGLPSRHFAEKHIKSLRSISFDTLIYSISFPRRGEGENIKQLNNASFECALL